MGRQKYPNGMRTQRERDNHVLKLAHAWADSGEFEGWLTVERALVARGFAKARGLLDDQYIRSELDRRCANAIKKRINETEKSGEDYVPPRTPVGMIDPTSSIRGTVQMNPHLQQTSEGDTL